MNVLILGKNEINAEVEKNLAKEGIDVEVMQDAAEILKFKGEPGAFTVTGRTGKFSFTAVIITEPPQFEAQSIDGETTINLMDDEETSRFDNLKTDEKIIILLDYGEETPEYITAKAIHLAKRLSEKKKDIVFLSRLVKTGFGDNELRYTEARNAGVTFIKYETLALRYDEEAGQFKIEANDGVFTLKFETPYVISAISRETPELKNISKKLNLYYKSNIRVNDDKFFLHPVFSTRRGIYYLNSGLVMPDKEESVKRVIFSIVEDMAAIKADGYQREIVRGLQFPEVDSDKCAFCYSCHRACPHGALAPDIDASAMKVIESSCQACGTCIAICPGEAITRKNFSRPPVGKGKCKIYCCENGAAEAFEGVLSLLGEYGQTIDSERVACGGSLGADRLTNDFKDYETVIVACCISGACRHMNGDKRACKQAFRAAEFLRRANLGNKRVEVIQVSHAMKNVMKDNILSILEGSN